MILDNQRESDLTNLNEHEPLQVIERTICLSKVLSLQTELETAQKIHHQ